MLKTNSIRNSQILIAAISCLIIAFFVLSIPIDNGMYRLLALINAEIACMEMFMFYRQPFSMHKIVNFFIITFFVIANAIQYSNKTIVSSISIHLTSNDYVYFQLWVLFILLLFNFSYPLIRADKRFSKLFKAAVNYNYVKDINYRLIIISFVAVLLVIYNFRSSPLQLIIRFDDFVLVDEMPESNIMSDLLFSKVIRTLPFVCYILACNYNSEKKVRVALFIFMLIALFPTSLSRNAMAMYWLPVLFFKWPLIMKRNVFVIVLLIGILFFFPFMNNFRDYNIGNEIDWGFDFSYMNTMHFDSSQEFMIAMREKVVTNGYQLLGVLFFFIPRSLWADKPVGSGEFLANMHIDAFPNISMPFWGEGYINFGIAGIVLFTLIIAAFCSFFDNRYWRSSPKDLTELKPVYFILLGALLFVLRGDLLSGYAYTITIIIDYYLVKKFVIKKDIVSRK